MRLTASPFEAARTALGAVNRAAAGLDRLAHVHEAKQAEPLIVVGLPRSGTTLVYELLVQAFDVAFLTKIYSYLYAIPSLTTKLMTPFTQHPTSVYRSDYGRIPGSLAPAENSNLWLQWFPDDPVLGHYVTPGVIGSARAHEANRIISSMSAIANKPFVFKNVYLTLAIPALLDIFPRARVVVVEREIEAVATSIWKARHAHPQRAWWSLKPPLYRNILDAELPHQIAFQCARSQQLMRRFTAEVEPDRITTVTYDDICARPRDVVTRIGIWAGDSLTPREVSDIPHAFEQSKSSGLPNPARTAFGASVAGFEDDQEAYMREVDQQVEACRTQNVR